MKVKATVYVMASDTDDGTQVFAFPTQAVLDIRRRAIIMDDIKDEEGEKPQEIRDYLGKGDTESAWDLWQEEFKGSLDTFNWDSVTLELDAEPVVDDTSAFTGVRLSQGQCQVFRVESDNSVALSPIESQRLSNHSPDGFEFGYLGSGPAQLALAILFDISKDAQTALRFYHDFKAEVIAMIKADSWKLPVARIQAWLDAKKIAAEMISSLR